jgi:hypothetical protein
MYTILVLNNPVSLNRHNLIQVLKTRHEDRHYTVSNSLDISALLEIIEDLQIENKTLKERLRDALNLY